MLRFLILVSIIILYNSCDHCICIPSDGLRLAMISFTTTDIDTIIKRKFVKESNFTNQVDSVIIDRNNAIFEAQTDTLQMVSWKGDIALTSKYDYQLFIPSINKTITVSNINEPQTDGNCDHKVQCVNRIVSVKLNGSSTPTLIQYDVLYLKK